MGEPESQQPFVNQSAYDPMRSAQPFLSGVPVYEDLLNHDPRWALNEGSRHFEEDSAVFKALHHIAERLKTLGVPYAVVGGMALFRHGLRRFTEDVDILVTKQDLRKIHDNLDGLGYLPPFRNSKHLRDTQFGVKIEFLTTGDYPGDGKKKPVSFPDPKSVSFEADGISYVKLRTLVELKLASGMTNPGRLKDLSDVMELIKTLDLPLDLADQLDEFVRDKFRELWMEARKRYVATWRNKPLTAEMQEEGVILEDNEGHAMLVTTDPKIAEKYGMVEESEYWGRDDENGAEETDDGPTDTDSSKE